MPNALFLWLLFVVASSVVVLRIRSHVYSIKFLIFETNIIFFGYYTLHFWRNIQNVRSNVERISRFRNGKQFLFPIKKCIRFFDGTSTVYNLGHRKIDQDVSFIK
jgi:hypothetical protein